MKNKTIVLLSLISGILVGCASNIDEGVVYVPPEQATDLRSCTYLGDVSARIEAKGEESEDEFHDRLLSIFSHKAIIEYNETNTLSFPKVKPKNNEKVFVTVQAFDCFR